MPNYLNNFKTYLIFHLSYNLNNFINNISFKGKVLKTRVGHSFLQGKIQKEIYKLLLTNVFQ